MFKPLKIAAIRQMFAIRENIFNINIWEDIRDSSSGEFDAVIIAHNEADRKCLDYAFNGGPGMDGMTWEDGTPMNVQVIVL
jgi:hypothetical protein